MSSRGKSNARLSGKNSLPFSHCNNSAVCTQWASVISPSAKVNGPLQRATKHEATNFTSASSYAPNPSGPTSHPTAWPLAEDIATLAKGPVDLSPEHVRRRLRAYGYGVGEGEAALRSAVMAFQRHFRPARLDGVADEETVILLEALLLRHRPDPALPTMVKP